MPQTTYAQSVIADALDSCAAPESPIVYQSPTRFVLRCPRCMHALLVLDVARWLDDCKFYCSTCYLHEDLSPYNNLVALLQILRGEAERRPLSDRTIDELAAKLDPKP